MDDRSIRILEYHKIVKKVSEFAVSEIGKEIVETLKPYDDRQNIYMALRETSQAESILASLGGDPVGGFNDITGVLKRASLGSMLSPAEFLRIADVLKCAHRTKRYINEYPGVEDISIIRDLSEKLYPQKELCEEILKCIEDEDNVSDYASSELASIRRRIRHAHDKVRDRLNDIIRSPKYQKYLQDPIVTIRGDRYVVPVKQEHKGNIKGIVHDQSSSGATLFIEPMAVVEANNEIRELMLKEKQEIERILLDLTEKVQYVHSDIKHTMDVLARLDFIFAKAKYSLSIRGVCPKLVDGQKLKIVNGRHPLIDKETVVPINVHIGYDFDVLVVTGPNTGGKTVTLKTIGLFVLMAQSGLHLPADEGTQIGIFDNIFADIGDEQSIEQNLSTFSSHMTNIVSIIENITDRSLVLFDELGAGTDPTEGAALAMSILDYLCKRHIKTAATTHYSEIKIFALTTQGMENASMEFDVSTLQPTYRLLLGVPGKSNAFEISKRLGLPDFLIDGAREFLTSEDIRFEDVLSTIEHNRVQSEKQLEEIKEKQQSVDSMRAELESRLAEIDRQKREIMKKSYAEANDIIKRAKVEADAAIKRIQKLASEEDVARRNREMEETRRSLKHNMNSMEERLDNISAKRKNSLAKPPKDLKLGQTVYIINLDQKGQVLTLPDNNGQLDVQVGIMKINVHISNLRETKEENQRQASSYKRPSIKDKHISQEIDLRGYTAEEAIMEVDRYLDDAFLAGLGEVSIIHGKGTGVLRTSIQQHLKSNPYVSSFRLGKYGEGETGVTIVKLK
ncbi:MAG: endonuclease MutS2 [Xylanivirga thermophila]|jgi:DNA mismatch repair protein MutS2|uniref:endonuclease MutS2 n=1 Tax=Xylanivirga thermophila TaxID=2496273 RepID=UPI00101C61D1|nr:endonuclease MutS2 [Xylanivirga thermophila]